MISHQNFLNIDILAKKQRFFHHSIVLIQPLILNPKLFIHNNPVINIDEINLLLSTETFTNFKR